MHSLAHRHQEATPALVPDSTCSFCNSKDCPFATYGKTDRCSEGGESWKLMNTFQNIHFGFDMYIYIIHIHIYVYLRMMVCECIEMHSYRGGRKHLFVKPALLSLQVWHFNNRPDNKHAFCVLCIVYMLCTVVHTTYYCKGPHILFFLPIFIRILIIYHSSIFFECIQLYRHIINETGLHIYIYIHICGCNRTGIDIWVAIVGI
jgi:hypothetical protein